MKQTKFMSLVEATSNVLIGFGVAVLMNYLVFPLFDIQTTMSDNVAIAVIFTAISLMRSFILRRIFEFVKVKKCL